FYFDKQVSFSRKHRKFVASLFQEFDLSGSCEIYKAVDWCLKNQTKEIVLSHDSNVLTEASYCFDFFSWFLNVDSNLIYSQIINFLKITCF
ncbi:MAG: DUF5616 domain-containing protein, partial [Promethearchaeota archaeon]